MRKPLSSFETGWLSIQQILFSILSIVLYFMQKYFLTHKLMRKQYRNWFSRSIIVGILYSYTITALIFWWFIKLKICSLLLGIPLHSQSSGRSGLAKYVCTIYVYSSSIAATMLMMSSLKVVNTTWLSPFLIKCAITSIAMFQMKERKRYFACYPFGVNIINISFLRQFAPRQYESVHWYQHWEVLIS